MKEQLDHIVAVTGGSRNYDNLPLDRWHPPLSGELPVRIDASGNWHHDGKRIERESLVRLFASILRREEDGEYYLVTPVEKWRISVELHPLLVVDTDLVLSGEDRILEMSLNTGKRVRVGEQYPLSLDARAGGIAVLHLSHGLTAMCSRPAWYRLVEMAEADQDSVIVRSGAYVFRLQGV